LPDLILVQPEYFPYPAADAVPGNGVSQPARRCYSQPRWEERLMAQRRQNEVFSGPGVSALLYQFELGGAPQAG
jgi:hypothetical protein